MGNRLRNIIVVVSIILLAVAAGFAAQTYLYTDPLDSLIIGTLAFVVLLVLHNHLSLQQHLRQVENHFRDIHLFEREIVKKTSALQTIQATASTGTKPANDADLALNETDGGREASKAQSGMLNALSPKSDTEDMRAHHEDSAPADNIIKLKSRMDRLQKPAPQRSLKIKPSQLSKALENGGTELYLQPILELPSRAIRYFEAFVRIKIGDNILTAKQFLPAAKNGGQIARIDLLSLTLTVKVVRGLQRQEKEYPVFWNIAPQTLGNKKIFNEIIEHLRANQPLNQQLICSIAHSAYGNLNTVQSDNLARIRDLGYLLCLNKIVPGALADGQIEHIIKSDIFSVIKIPVNELMRIGKDDIANFAEFLAPLVSAKNVTLIASEIENDAQTLSMIDADVYLAQGDGLMPAKALKKELGN